MQRRPLIRRVLTETGMRVGELAALEWGDVDEAESRFRIKIGKTAAGAAMGRGAGRSDGRRRADLSAGGPNA